MSLKWGSLKILFKQWAQLNHDETIMNYVSNSVGEGLNKNGIFHGSLNTPDNS